jgi:hypothetical protein
MSTCSARQPTRTGHEPLNKPATDYGTRRPGYQCQLASDAILAQEANYSATTLGMGGRMGGPRRSTGMRTTSRDQPAAQAGYPVNRDGSVDWPCSPGCFRVRTESRCNRHAAKLARHVRTIWRLASVVGTSPQLGHDIDTVPLTSSTAISCAHSQRRHQRCPVTGMACDGELTHW